MAILGNTLSEIAGEKAGIIKPRSFVVLEPQEQEAMDVLLKNKSHKCEWIPSGARSGCFLCKEQQIKMLECISM